MEFRLARDGHSKEFNGRHNLLTRTSVRSAAIPGGANRRRPPTPPAYPFSFRTPGITSRIRDSTANGVWTGVSIQRGGDDTGAHQVIRQQGLARACVEQRSRPISRSSHALPQQLRLERNPAHPFGLELPRPAPASEQGPSPGVNECTMNDILHRTATPVN